MLFLSLLLNLIVACTAEEVADDLLDPDYFEKVSFDGDIIVPLSLRNSATDRAIWTDGVIPVVFERNVDQNLKNLVIFVMARYRMATDSCITFVKRTDERDYVLIYAGGYGCYSHVGRTGGKQVVHLASGCRMRGTVAHELLHAVGFYHEQSRTDRDYYVSIQYQNVDPGKADQFNINYNSETYGVPYDYLSIVHYGTFDFSFNGFPTILTLDQRYQNRIGRSFDLSARDIQKIKKKYNCSTSSSPFS